MIDNSKLEALRQGVDFTRPKDTKKMTVDDLLKLRDEINANLPEMSLDSVNLEQELVVQYHRVKGLQLDVLDDDTIPLNQRAQLAGQVASTLDRMVKMQVELKRGEQLKRMETALLDAISSLPEEVKEKFFDEYERLAEKHNAMEFV